MISTEILTKLYKLYNPSDYEAIRNKDFQLTIEEFENSNKLKIRFVNSGASIAGQEMILINEILKALDKLEQDFNNFIMTATSEIALINDNLYNINQSIENLKKENEDIIKRLEILENE